MKNTVIIFVLFFAQLSCSKFEAQNVREELRAEAILISTILADEIYDEKIHMCTFNPNFRLDDAGKVIFKFKKLFLAEKFNPWTAFEFRPGGNELIIQMEHPDLKDECLTCYPKIEH